MRYAPFGVMLRKKWLYERGGRPVIYQTESEFSLLHAEHQFRHVRYQPGTISDHTWEREWRVKIDALSLEKSEVTFIVPTRRWEERFFDGHAANLRLLAWFDSDMAEFGTVRSPLHFLTLQDLGVDVEGYVE